MVDPMDSDILDSKLEPDATASLSHGTGVMLFVSSAGYLARCTETLLLDSRALEPR